MYGGCVKIHGGAWKVHGVLSVSRGIGDCSWSSFYVLVMFFLMFREIHVPFIIDKRLARYLDIW